MKRPLAESMAAYLGLGTTSLVPGPSDERLVAVAGTEAPVLRADLDRVLATLLQLPEEWKHEPLARLAELAAERTRQLHPDFSPALCQEIGRFFCWHWK